MKAHILILTAISTMFISCQNKWQKVEYKGISVQIPSDWGNTNTKNYYEENEITEYQISCWANDESISTLTIQWIDAELDADIYIESIIETQKERSPIFKQTDFDGIIDCKFHGLPAKKCYFNNSFYDISFKVKCISFTKNQYSYIVIIWGNEKFYKSNDYNKILSSISINYNFLDKKEQSDKTISISETDENFTRYEFKQYSLSIPNTMELRDENSMMSLGASILRDKMKNIMKIDFDDFNFVFQPVGTDDVEDFDRRKEALQLYSRVIINYEKGNTNHYLKWDDDITMSQSEYDKLNKIFRNNLLEGAKQIEKMGRENPLINIENIEVNKNANKFIYIKQQYTNKGFYGNVIVTDYHIHNNNEMVILTISYRVAESNLWETDFSKIIDSFEFSIKK